MYTYADGIDCTTSVTATYPLVVLTTALLFAVDTIYMSSIHVPPRVRVTNLTSVDRERVERLYHGIVVIIYEVNISDTLLNKLPHS